MNQPQTKSMNAKGLVDQLIGANSPTPSREAAQQVIPFWIEGMLYIVELSTIGSKQARAEMLKVLAETFAEAAKKIEESK